MLDEFVSQSWEGNTDPFDHFCFESTWVNQAAEEAFQMKERLFEPSMDMDMDVEQEIRQLGGFGFTSEQKRATLHWVLGGEVEFEREKPPKPNLKISVMPKTYEAQNEDMKMHDDTPN